MEKISGVQNRGEAVRLLQVTPYSALVINSCRREHVQYREGGGGCIVKEKICQHYCVVTVIEYTALRCMYMYVAADFLMAL